MNLLDHLTQNFKAYNKTKLKQFLKHGSIAVNGQVRTAFNFKVQTGDKIEILSRKKAVVRKTRAHLPFTIIYEDDSLVVIDKPEGLLTMGTDKDKFNTAYFVLTDYVRENSDAERIYIVHRLDRDASGLLVFAKTEEAKLALQSNWKEVIKKYYAIVEGRPRPESGKVESYLIEDKFRRVYSVEKPRPGAQRATLEYETLKADGEYALLNVTLITGRKNQIRVQLADLGHPIVGDQKYGSTQDPLGRLGLHAYFLAFKHPATGELKTFKIPEPKSFHAV